MMGPLKLIISELEETSGVQDVGSVGGAGALLTAARVVSVVMAFVEGTGVMVPGAGAVVTVGTA